jgi:uncharacterized protein YjbI with pentapeptide repeats
MDANELLKRYKTGERDFFGVDLTDADLSGSDLSGIDLSTANLNNANLSDTNLSQAFLIQTNLTYANLNYASLNDTDLSASNLIGANLSGADLSGALLSEVHLSDANLSEACLCDANLSRANLNGANLSRANLIDAQLGGANLNNIDLSEASLNRASLNGTNLNGANLRGAILKDADLSDANLVKANLTNTQLTGAKLDGTILTYQKISEELTKRLDFFETEIENIIEHEVQKRLVTNQGYSAKKKLTWNRLRFRSEPELEIAKVLDEMGIMYFPNASGRVMSDKGMTTREVDFLICWRGKWGILECDSEILHLVNSIKKGKLPSAASDHKRDNDFNRHGQWFIKRFTAEECRKNSHQVVTQFLDMLHKFHEDQCYLIRGDSTGLDTSPFLTKNYPLHEDSSPKNSIDAPDLCSEVLANKEENISSNESTSLDNLQNKVTLVTAIESASSSLSDLIKIMRKN